MALPGYAESFLAGALDSREALLCMARKNAKSAICAVLALGYLAGPLRTAGWRGAVASLGKDKAGELRSQCEAIALASGLDGLRFRRVPYPGKITSETGQLEILSADRSAGHASSFDLVIADELGLFPARARELMAGLRSSVSAKDGRLLAISVRGDSPLLEEMLARAELPETHVALYAGEAGADLFDERAWAAANPGLGVIKSRNYMLDAARRAAATPADQGQFRAYDLNERLNPAHETVVTVDQWQACEADELPAREGRCYVGVDLGGSASMTCAVAYWPASGRMQAWGAFPSMPGLRERGQADGVGAAYETMQAQGQLRTYGGQVTDVAAFLADVFGEIGGRVAAVGCDRYRRSEMEEAARAAGLRFPLTWRGTGASRAADGSHDVRAFQRAVLQRQVHVQRCQLWRMALRYAVLRYDPAGNPALDKSGIRHRIDAVQAGVIAAGLAASRTGRKRKILRVRAV